MTHTETSKRWWTFLSSLGARRRYTGSRESEAERGRMVELLRDARAELLFLWVAATASAQEADSRGVARVLVARKDRVQSLISRIQDELAEVDLRAP